MRILVSPVLVGARICRIVSPIDSLLEVEEWVGAWWEPSSVSLTVASQSPSAPVQILEDRGVPPADRVTTEPRPSDPDIQSALRALEPHIVSGTRIEDSVGVRPSGPRRREYTGNARFRRAARDGEWKGPKRRATDDPDPDARRHPTS